MKKAQILLAMIVLALNNMSCETRQSPLSFQDEIEEYRMETEEFMNNSEDSPFFGVDSLVKLSYYPTDEKFKVIASINRIQDSSQVTLGTSDGQTRIYSKHAVLEFELDNEPLQLLVLKSQEGKDLFLAFADLTSDNDTYGGGRYINLTFSDQAEKFSLDFNKAYNPYCAYTASYSCPLPPVENYLKVAIEAGEKDFAH